FEEGRYLGLFVPQKRTKTPKQCLEQFGVKAKAEYIGDTDRIFPDGTMRPCGVFHLSLKAPIPIPYKYVSKLRRPDNREYCVVWRWWFSSEVILKIIGHLDNEFVRNFLGCQTLRATRNRILSQLALAE